MTALTANRDTLARPNSGPGRKDEFPVANGAKLYQGAIACLDASGRVVPASTSTGLVALGRVVLEHPAAMANDQFKVQTQIGVYNYVSATGGGDDIASDDKGKLCYLVDDQTVALTDGTGTRSKAGIVYDVDSDGVWVSFVFGNAIL